MKVAIMDYLDERREVEVGELSSIDRMEIIVLSGDEILRVIRKDETDGMFDSSETRTLDIYNGAYEIYRSASTKPQLIDNKSWLNRASSYDGLNLR